jgi:hypothetical protein
MGLKDLRSRFDRHTIQDPAVPPAQLSGQTVGGEGGIIGPTPSQGDYFSDNRTSDSPFDTVRGPKMEQMVQMLANTITSKPFDPFLVLLQCQKENLKFYYH